MGKGNDGAMFYPQSPDPAALKPRTPIVAVFDD
jgi:hypothetical protein